MLEQRHGSLNFPPPAPPEIREVPTHPFAPGTEVAARRQDDSEWIQAKVVRWDATKRKYELEDAEPDDSEASYVCFTVFCDSGDREDGPCACPACVYMLTAHDVWVCACTGG